MSGRTKLPCPKGRITVPNRQSYRSSNIFAGVHQQSNGLSLFVLGQPVPLLLLRELFPDVVFREAERGDGSSGVLIRFPLQLFRRMREKAKEDRAAYR